MAKRQTAAPARIVITGQVRVTKVGSRGQTAIDDPQRLRRLDGWVYDEETCSEYLEGALADIGLTGGALGLVWDKEASELRLVTEYDSPRQLTPQELKQLVRVTEGQWSDGIGEGGLDSIEPEFECTVEYSLQPARAEQLASKRKAKAKGDAADDPNERDKQGRTRLHRAIESGDERAALQLIKQGADVVGAAKDGGTPLHAAVHRGSAELVWALISRGADVNAIDNDGFSPLMYAVMNGNRAAIETLLREGANVNAERTSAGERNTALMWALYPDLVELLLKQGADPSLGDKPGRTAADYFFNRAALAESDPRSKREAVGLRAIARLIQEHLK